MRTLSVLLTLFLLIPILVNLSLIFQHHYFLSFDASASKTILVNNLFSIFFYVVVIVVAFILNNMEKYLENSIMCGTLLGTYIIFTAFFYISTFLMQWLK